MAVSFRFCTEVFFRNGSSLIHLDVYFCKFSLSFCVENFSFLLFLLVFEWAANFVKFILQGSYASGKCQGNLKFFKVRELSGNFIICQGKMNFC